MIHSSSTSTDSHVRHRRISALLALLCACAIGMTLLFPSGAAAEGGEQSLGTGRFTLPAEWSFEEVAPFQIGSMPANVGVAQAPDQRVSVYLLVIDPFGIDMEWTITSVLAPTLLNTIVDLGAKRDRMRVRKSVCQLGGEPQVARMVVYPMVEERRLLAGVACGYAEVSRWVIAVVVVDTAYDRPVLLLRSMEEANSVLRTFSWKD